LDKHLERLKNILRDLDSVLVAFSGGVDSSFLLHTAHEVLGERALALTFVSPFMSRLELNRASQFCKEREIEHILFGIDPLADEEIRENPPDRCYHCKRQLFSQGLAEAQRLNIPYLVEGTQLSDASDHRPGHRALEELEIRSPLAEAGLDKEQVRLLSKKFLASRIPYGTPISPQVLARIEAAEEFLFNEGFNLVRVRDHHRMARIELSPEGIERFSHRDLRDRLVAHFKSLGFVAVTLDLEGYRTGRLNELLKEEKPSGRG
jgi:uncharacterized protein